MKYLKSLLLLATTFVYSYGIAQFKTYQPGSIQESYLLMSSNNLINGFRFYPQTPELVAEAWNRNVDNAPVKNHSDTFDVIQFSCERLIDLEKDKKAKSKFA
jgi:hypothetical protein